MADSDSDVGRTGEVRLTEDQRAELDAVLGLAIGLGEALAQSARRARKTLYNASSA